MVVGVKQPKRVSWGERWAREAVTNRKGYSYRQKSDVERLVSKKELAELMDRYGLILVKEAYAYYLFPVRKQA